MFKKEQAITDLANIYDLTVRSLISNTFVFISDITDPKVLKRYKESIVFAISDGCDHGLTNHSFIGNNDVYCLLKFMEGLVKPSEKLSHDNIYKDNDEEMKKALNEGVNRILIELIKDSDNFTDEQKKTMLMTLIEG